MANVNIRLPTREAKQLAAYAKNTGRTRTDILRAYIRSLTPAAKSRPPRRRKP